MRVTSLSASRRGSGLASADVSRTPCGPAPVAASGSRRGLRALTAMAVSWCAGGDARRRALRSVSSYETSRTSRSPALGEELLDGSRCVRLAPRWAIGPSAGAPCRSPRGASCRPAQMLPHDRPLRADLEVGDLAVAGLRLDRVLLARRAPTPRRGRSDPVEPALQRSAPEPAVRQVGATIVPPPTARSAPSRRPHRPSSDRHEASVAAFDPRALPYPPSRAMRRPCVSSSLAAWRR